MTELPSLALALGQAVPEAVSELGRTLAAHHFRAWAVGGSVRDILRATLRGEARPFDGDWDVATDARPEQVRACFRKVIPTGIAHGTVTVLLQGASIEVTTLRGEKGHSDGRRPDEVYFVDDLAEDLARRDFTVNAMAFNLASQELADPFHGLEDLKGGVLRAVGDPRQRYHEDGLRPLRAARFAAQLEMSLEEQTRRAIRGALERFALVSMERVREEWLKALKTRCPSRFLRVLFEEGLLGVTLPKLYVGAGIEQLSHVFDVVDHAAPDAVRRLTHFLSAGLEGQGPKARAFAAEEAAVRLKLSNQERARVSSLIAAEDVPPREPAAIRRYLCHVGRERAEDALTYLAERGADEALVADSRRELASGAPLAQRDLLLSGHDLLQAGMKPGPQMKFILDQLLQWVLTEPTHNRRELLLDKAKQIAASAEASS